jgi:hypothetical protein
MGPQAYSPGPVRHAGRPGNAPPAWPGPAEYIAAYTFLTMCTRSQAHTFMR